MMTIMLWMVNFLLGASFASFFMCWIEAGHLPLLRRSACNQCGKALTPRQLVPVLGFFIQAGRCKHCRQQIPWTYPLVEIFSGLSFLALGNWDLFSSQGLCLLCLFLGLLFASIYDCYHLSITWTNLVYLLTLALTFSFLNNLNILPGLVLWLCLEVYVGIFPHALGGGDAKLLGLLSLTLPTNLMPFLLTASALLGLLAFFLTSVLKGPAFKQNVPLPFIPAISLAYVLIQGLVLKPI